MLRRPSRLLYSSSCMLPCVALHMPWRLLHSSSRIDFTLALVGAIGVSWHQWGSFDQILARCSDRVHLLDALDSRKALARCNSSEGWFGTKHTTQFRCRASECVAVVMMMVVLVVMVVVFVMVTMVVVPGSPDCTNARHQCSCQDPLMHQ